MFTSLSRSCCNIPAGGVFHRLNSSPTCKSTADGAYWSSLGSGVIENRPDSNATRICLAEVFGLSVSNGYLAKICTKTLSIALQPAYAEVAETIRNADVIGTDETGHNDSGILHWVWCQQDRKVAFFHISESRGSKVLNKILGNDFSGILQCDYFSANKKFVRDNSIPVQFCWAHFIRDIKSVGESLYSSVRRPPDYGDARTLSKRFRGRRGEQDYFLFLDADGVEPTNNRTEQAIRHVVIDRRVTQGTRSWAGMRWCERAWTFLTPRFCRLEFQ